MKKDIETTETRVMRRPRGAQIYPIDPATDNEKAELEKLEEDLDKLTQIFNKKVSETIKKIEKDN